MAGRIGNKTKLKKINSAPESPVFLDPNNQYQQLLSTIESMQDGLFAINTQRQITYINNFAAKLFGKKIKDLFGFKLEEVLPRDSYPIFNQGVDRTFKLRQTQIFELFSKALKRWILVHIYPAENGLTVYFQDITPQKKLTDELIKTSYELELIMENIHDGIVLIDISGKIIYGNQAVANLFGYANLEEFSQRKLYDILLKDFDPINEKGQIMNPDQLPSRRVFKDGRSAQEIIGFKSNKTGQVRWVISKANLISIEGEKTPLAVVIYEEITERITNEQHRELLFGGVSHELKNMVASSRAYLLLLRKRLQSRDEPELLEYITKADERIHHLNYLLLDFTELIRVRSGNLKLRKRQRNLKKLILEVMTDMKLTNPDFKFDLEISQLPKVKLDPGRIRQVIINLLDNAIKYSTRIKKAKVRIYHQQQQVIISIQDFGMGIAKKQLSRLFDPFYRAGLEHKGPGGLGLGLFISSEIIKMHGGEIIVKSQKGQGSTFTILIPLDQTSQ